MYKRIVVPLDGSKLAECVLPHVETVATSCGTEEVFLISVTEHITAYATAARPEQRIGLGFVKPIDKVPLSVGKQQRQAEKYLARIAKQLKRKKIDVETEVLLGNPAEKIVSFTNDKGADLIIMATHGRSGISQWAHSIGAFGGVADKVIRASSVPVLLVRA